MRIQVSQKELENASKVVSGLVERSASSIPVIGNILIEASERGVQFRGTDIESFVTVNLNASVTRQGRTTIPAETFRDIVMLMPPMAEVVLDENANRVSVTCENNEYKLSTLSADDFPEWPAEAAESRFQIAQKTLKSMIDASTYALPVKDHRRVLLGVFFELNNNVLRLTATDGKKLARVHCSVPEVEGAPSCSLVIPRKLLDNLSRYLSNEGPVDIEISTRQIVFRFGNVIYRGNGIEGKYPDCDAVIPKEFPISIGLNRDLFLQASKRAGVVTDDKNRSIIIKLQDNVCHFRSSAHDIGSFSGKLSLDYAGPPLELAFNFHFLNETLSHFSTPEVRMLVKTASAPVVFKSTEDENRLALLMPIKLTDIRPAGVDDEDEGA